MFSRHRRKLKLLFGLSDVVLTALAFVLAYETRLRLPGRVFFLNGTEVALLLGVSALSTLLIGLWLQVYDRLESAHPRVILRDTLRQCALGGVSIVVFEFLIRLDLSRLFLGLFVFYSWLLLCVFRLNAGNLVGAVRRRFGARHFVMVVGGGEQATKVARLIEASSSYGVRLLGQVSEADALAELPKLLERHVIDEIIFAVPSDRVASLEEVFLLCDEEGVRTRVAVDFFPHVNSDVYLDRLQHIPLLTFSAAPHDEIRLLLKRTLDVLLAAAALILVAPIMIVIALLIRLTSPGPVIFRQQRCGLNGRRFEFYKFRSMVDNAEALKAELEQYNAKKIAFKIPNDPRLTPLGRWLRKFSIDEWPQLWNVLKGDMSLVGPRPAVPSEVEQYERWQRRRLRMRPGLTCLWAVSGRDSLDFDTWMKLDMQYIDNWSLMLDWKIIFRTIPHVVTGKGAH